MALAQHATAPEPYDVAEAYQVYNVLLPREEAAGSEKGTLVIQQETVPGTYPTEPCLTPEAASKFKEAVADYKQVNTKPWLLRRQFQTEEPYEVVSSQSIQTLFKRHDWEGFYKRYPDSGGYITLSGVGFNQDKTRAIVYSGTACGLLCGRWSWHLLEKIEGRWKEVPGVSCLTVS
jgi:hypothetical protein